MTTERSDKLFEASRDAQVKFDYFVLGIVGALCAFVGQSFEPSPLGWNPSTMELTALLLFVGSAVAGFRRIESTNQLMRMNSQYLRMQEEKGALKPTLGSSAINHSTGEIYTPQQVVSKVAALAEIIPSFRGDIDKVGATTLRTYKFRNWLLLIGFLALLGSRVWSAYV